jgi:hypothetical protein
MMNHLEVSLVQFHVLAVKRDGESKIRKKFEGVYN